MAPIRRYLRISKYSVLECRIYLDNPALAQSWLLNPRNPVLPKVIESVRPLVLPKLHEEKERAAKKKSSKKKQIKDVVVGDEFEVSVFLTETLTRHSLLTRHKLFREKFPQKMLSTSTKLIDETNSSPVDVDAGENRPVLAEPDDDDENVQMADIPLAEASAGADSPIDVEDSTGQFPTMQDNDEDEDKKKLAMDVTYEGFAIYGRVLCLVVKKRDPRLVHTGNAANTGKASGQGQARMENWISSTQAPLGEDGF